MSVANDARFWDRTARKYARGAVADQAGYERTLTRTAGLLRPGDTVLELGCGTGTTALRLAGAVAAYLATDISPEMIAIVKERWAEAPAPNLSFRAATAEALTADASAFDAVLAFNYLHLVRDLSGTLRQVGHLLAPGGLFISKTPCVGDMNPAIRLVVPAMRAIGLAPYAGVFRAADLVRRMEAAGFSILATELHATKGEDHRPFVVARKS